MYAYIAILVDREIFFLPNNFFFQMRFNTWYPPKVQSESNTFLSRLPAHNRVDLRP